MERGRRGCEKAEGRKRQALQDNLYEVRGGEERLHAVAVETPKSSEGTTEAQ